MVEGGSSSGGGIGGQQQQQALNAVGRQSLRSGPIKERKGVHVAETKRARVSSLNKSLVA